MLGPGDQNPGNRRTGGLFHRRDTMGIGRVKRQDGTIQTRETVPQTVENSIKDINNEIGYIKFYVTSLFFNCDHYFLFNCDEAFMHRSLFIDCRVLFENQVTNETNRSIASEQGIIEWRVDPYRGGVIAQHDVRYFIARGHRSNIPRAFATDKRRTRRIFAGSWQRSSLRQTSANNEAYEKYFYLPRGTLHRKNAVVTRHTKETTKRSEKLQKYPIPGYRRTCG